jgi:ribosomal protein S18 acetylase RimI-like enzyme
MAAEVEIEVAREASGELVDAFARLLPQLSATAAAPDRAALAHVVGCAANTVLVARSDGRIVGALTLVVFPLATGLRARIEDVVVDDAARGRGIGAALTEEALRLAERAGARTVDLTSRPTRRAANRLYERVGFRPHETRVYRFDVDR